MKNRILSLVVVLTMMMSFAPIVVKAEVVDSEYGGRCGDNLTWMFDDEGTLTISGTGEMWDYTSNSCAPWCAIGYYSTKIKKIHIENSVTSIGNHAFYGLNSNNCASSISITIGSDIKSIGDYAFSGCDVLTSIIMLNGVTSIGNYAFSWCTGITSITIPSSVINIGDYVFMGCEALTSATIGGVRNMGHDVFSANMGLRSVTIESGTIGNSAFSECDGLISVAIKNGVTTIGEFAFSGCGGLTSVTIPSSVTSIGAGAFSMCDGLTSITIPSSVTSIGAGAFSGKNLTEINISATNMMIYNGHTYAVYDYAYSWDEAKAMCEKLGGHLVAITSEGEQKAIEKLFSSNFTYVAYWIGGYQKNKKWHWVTEETFTFAHWAPGQPSNSSSTALQIYSPQNGNPHEIFYWDDTWNNGDIGGGIKQEGFICEWDYKKSVISVHKTDVNSIENNVESELNSLLSSVTLCDTTIKGPTFDVAGYNICPLEFGAKAVLDFSGLSKNITIDKDNKKIHVILGKLNKNGSASVVQTTDMCDASWSKQYNEIKDLYKSMTGFNASGSDRNGINNWNKFEKMKAELNHMNCDMFISASMDCVAYLDFDYHTGYLQLSEGGFIESASLGTNFKYPLIGNCLYATLGLKGSETGTIKATLTSSGTINPQMSIKPSITAKASITGEIPFLCKAEGGVDATLAVLLQTFDPKLTVTMNGNIFLNASVLNKTLVDWSKPYLNIELYPEFKTLSLMSLYNNYKDTYDNAVSMPRNYLNTVSLFSLGEENALYNQNGVYPYNDAQLVRLPGNAMMLLWTGDDGTKSDINRTSLMYSIYKNGLWSEMRKIAEDGTATGSFKAVSDGEKAYIVYQKLSQVLDYNTSVDDMLAVADLYVVKYENGAFSLPICLNNYDNTAYESIGDINLNGDNLTVAWIENSVNDIFLSKGTSYVKTRSIVNDTMSSVNTISALSAADHQYPGDVHIADDTIYYAVYDASVEKTTADLYTYSNETSEKLLDADKIYNIKNIGNTLYYIRHSSIYKLENGTETELGFDNITSFEIISNDDYCSMLISVCDGARNEIYISNLVNGEWSQAEHFTDLGKYIRSYSPFMYDDGTINLAVSAAEVNDNIEEGESVYGNTSIMVLNQCDYCDISTSYVYYEEDEIQPNGDMNLYFDVNNDSSNSLNSVKVKLTDENGNQLDEQTVECAIAPFSTEKLNIKYHLPQNISKTHLNLTVSIDGEEKNYSNNTVTTEFGYSNINVSPIECTVNKNNTADIKSTISNVGFEDAENVIVKVYNGNINGDVLNEINIGTMAVGGTYELEYTFPEEIMVSSDIDVMNAVYIQAETSSVESLYSDNEQKIAFDSYNGEPVTSPTAEPIATPTTSPTTTPTAKPTITPTVEPTTSPNPSPTAIPTATPTVLPTTSPTATPTIKPTEKPKETDTPTTTPIAIPTAKPTDKPQETEKPTITLKTMPFEIQNAAVNDKVTADIVNTSDTEQSGIVIFAAYTNDGKLVSVKCQNIDNIAASDTLPCEFDIPEGAEKYRLLVWNAWKHIIPLAESVEVK